MTALQRNLLSQLAQAKSDWPASWLIDDSPLKDRRHTANPNGNNGGGDWRRKTIGSVLAGMRKKGWVALVSGFPKTWLIAAAGLAALEADNALINKTQGVQQ